MRFQEVLDTGRSTDQIMKFESHPSILSLARGHSRHLHVGLISAEQLHMSRLEFVWCDEAFHD